MMKSVFSFFCVVLLSACGGLRSPEVAWPENLPPQQYFRMVYAADEANHALQSEADYLRWVVRFYEGSMAMPTGWNDITRSLQSGLDKAGQEALEEKRRRLGLLISAEWAKDNRVRMVDTGMLSLWGDVMQALPEPQQRLAALDAIIDDVQELRAEELEPAAIDAARYERDLNISLSTDEWWN